MSESRFSGNGPEIYTSARHALVDSITGERVSVTQSAVRSVSAGHADIHQSAVERLAAENVTLEQSAALRVQGTDVSLRRCAALGVLGGNVTAEGCRTIFLCSPSVSGNFQALITPRTAFALGVGFFLGRRFARLTGRLLGRP